MKPGITTLRRLIEEAQKYPLQLRIAAWYVRRGGSFESWWKIQDRLEDLPSPTVVDIFNYLRDIHRGAYDVSKIPKV